jgi:hypothetical protein
VLTCVLSYAVLTCVSPASAACVNRAQAIGEAITKALQEDTTKKYLDEGSDLVTSLKRR